MTTPSARSGTIEVTVRQDGAGRSVVSLVGDLDHGHQAQVWSSFEDLIVDGRTHVIVDLSQVPFCDSSGLGLLVRLHRLTEISGGWTRLAAPHRDLRRMLQITNLDRILPVYESVGDAAEGGALPA